MAHKIRECSFDGCSRRHVANGVCETHYGQKRRGVDLNPVRNTYLTLRCIECIKPVYDRNLCSEHYMEWWWEDYDEKALARLEKSVSKPYGEEGCWLWSGRSLNPQGYGAFTYDNRVMGAHRVLYALKVDRNILSNGRQLHLDHLCRVRACVNPAHLEPVAPAVNNARGVAVQAACDFCNPPPARDLAEVQSRAEPWRIAAMPAIDDLMRAGE